MVVLYALYVFIFGPRSLPTAIGVLFIGIVGII